MIKNRYVKLLGILIICYVFVLTVDGILTSISYPLLIYFMIEHEINHSNLIPHALLIGFFNDFVVMGVFGISVFSLILFFFLKELFIRMLHYENIFVKFLYSLLSYSLYVVLFVIFSGLTSESELSLFIFPVMINSILFFLVLFLKDFNYAVSLS
jgi:cell shape-determining protein MreD